MINLLAKNQGEEHEGKLRKDRYFLISAGFFRGMLKEIPIAAAEQTSAIPKFWRPALSSSVDASPPVISAGAFERVCLASVSFFSINCFAVH